MASLKPKFATKQVDPSLKDLLDLYKTDIMISLNCHAIATVQSFDPVDQTISANIAYKKTVTTKTGTLLLDYPPLIDIPVMVLGGGASALTFPIAQGDECLILFNDRDLDNWFEGNPAQGVATPRLHSFSDGIALVGLRSLGKSLAAYDMTRVALRNDQAMVAVGPLLVKIANNTTTLNTLLQSLLTTLEGLTTTNAVVGAPCALSPATIAALTSIGTQIAGLLE